MTQRRQSKGPPRYAWEEYCRFSSSMVPGNRIELLIDAAAAYPSMLEAIESAQRTIVMASYIFNDDQAGRAFAAALSERARRGVRVCLIVDGVGTLGQPSELFDDMRRNKVRLLVYRSPAPWRRGWGLLRRDHRKLLVVDGEIGFAGGLNIGKEWLSWEEGGQAWHDVHIRVEGPAARDLSKLALETWRVHEKIELDPKIFLPDVGPRGDQYVSIIGSKERSKRRAIRQAYMYAIRRAQDYIYIANAYFLPERGFRRALRQAVERGVDVRVMVPERGDILPVQLASQAKFGRLLRSGVRMFLWRNAVLHAKTAVIDDQWATVGSFNIDHRSWAMNLEVNVNVVGGDIPRQLAKVFVDDQAHCRELTRREWHRRPLLLRFFEQFFYLFRKWM